MRKGVLMGMKKRKILATGTIMASMLLSGASATFAQTIKLPKAAPSSIEKETLIEEGFSPSQIHKVLTQESHESKRGRK